MNQTNSHGIHDLIDIVNRRKWMVVVPLVLGTAIGGLIAYSLPAYYKSSTLVLVEQQKVPEAYVKSTDETPIERRLSTISQQILSRTKLEQIITDLNLYRERNDLYSKVKRWVGLASSKKASREEQVEAMKKDIELKVIGGSGSNSKGGDAFSINYIGRDPYLTMQVTNTLASFFIEENLKVREEYAEGTSEFLGDELEKSRKELEGQEKALKGFKEKYMGRLPQQMEANLRTLDRLQMELQTTQISLKNSEDKRAIVEEQVNLLSSSTTPVERRAASNPLAAELARLKSELTAMLATYKDNYPDVIIAKNKIKEMENQLATSSDSKEGDTIVPQYRGQDPLVSMSASLAELKSHIGTLKKQEADIREQIRIYQKRVEDTPASEQMMANIERDYLTSRNNYQTLLSKKLSANLAENMEKRQKGEHFRVIDPANLPEKPFKPDRVKVALGGSAIGLVIGAGLVYLLEFLNPAFRRPEDLAGVLGKPVLAVIPVYNHSSVEKKPSKLRLLKKG